MKAENEHETFHRTILDFPSGADEEMLGRMPAREARPYRELGLFNLILAFVWSLETVLAGEYLLEQVVDPLMLQIMSVIIFFFLAGMLIYLIRWVTKLLLNPAAGRWIPALAGMLFFAGVFFSTLLIGISVSASLYRDFQAKQLHLLNQEVAKDPLNISLHKQRYQVLSSGMDEKLHFFRQHLTHGAVAGAMAANLVLVFVIAVWHRKKRLSVRSKQYKYPEP